MRKVFGQWLYDTHAWRVKDSLALWVQLCYDWNQAMLWALLFGTSTSTSLNEFGKDVPLRCKNDVRACINSKFYSFTEPGNKDLAAAMYNGYECRLRVSLAPKGRPWISDRFHGVHDDQSHLQQSRVNLKPGVHIINSFLLDNCLQRCGSDPFSLLHPSQRARVPGVAEELSNGRGGSGSGRGEYSW